MRKRPSPSVVNVVRGTTLAPLAQVAREQLDLGARDRRAALVDQAAADAGLGAVAERAAVALAGPWSRSATALPVSVAFAPLTAPRSDGVTANTGYGPLSTTLPPVSVTRTTTRALAGRQRVAGRTVSRLRLGHGAGRL